MQLMDRVKDGDPVNLRSAERHFQQNVTIFKPFIKARCNRSVSLYSFTLARIAALNNFPLSPKAIIFTPLHQN